MAAAVAHGNVRRNVWSGINVAAGAWLFISAFIIPNAQAMSWPQECLGVIVVISALTSLSNEVLFTQRFLAKRRA